MTEDEFAAYQSLAEDVEDHRWAFGTGFTDPLEGVDASVPDGVDAAALAAYCLMLGDDALIYSHRLQQWMTRLPELEEETALANIALDLLGQARMLLARAGQAEGAARAESEKARLLADATSDPTLKLRIAVTQATIDTLWGKAPAAVSALQSAEKDALKSGDVALSLRVRVALGEAQHQAGKIAEARTTLAGAARDAKAKGFGLIARNAESAAANLTSKN